MAFRDVDVVSLVGDAQRWVSDDPSARPIIVNDNARPDMLAKALDALADTTDKLAEKDYQRIMSIPGIPIVLLHAKYTKRDMEGDDITRTLWDWQDRLAYYIDLVNEAPGDDREEVFRTVTMPLFFGWHDPEGMPQYVRDTYPTGFDFNVQHIPDIAYPGIVSNMLKVQLDFDDKVWSLTNLLGDFRASYRQVVETVKETVQFVGGSVLVPVGVLAAGLGVLWWATRR